ncbi:hypothetical protein LEP1GSC036_4111 [Leptospira weilii str. 2006001853]|uniref:Uncharacterized protein n=1 Tax=Leptospira weilii str. 2006001853 TaxID=1001589 RepID=A0A828Z3V9_9LEPT|nr:hypothetical protein LEP1GSC036_4111 [Leptospira weilii str. 2006001853]
MKLSSHNAPLKEALCLSVPYFWGEGSGNFSLSENDTFCK